MKNWLFCSAVSLAAVAGFILDFDRVDSSLDNTHILKVLQSKAVVVAATISLSISFPLILELLAEIFYQRRLSNDFFERVLIVSMIYVGGATALCSDFIPNIANVFVSFRIFQVITSLGFILSLMNKFDPVVFSKRSLYVMLFFAVGACNLYKFEWIKGYSAIRTTFSALFYFIFISKILIWAYYMLKKYQASRKSLKSFIAQLNNDEYMGLRTWVIAIFYILLFGLGLGLVIGSNLSKAGPGPDTIESVCFRFVASTFLAFLLVGIPGMSKVESIKLLEKLDTKQTFVRYVSHEIRTPLNTVCMGLDLIERQLLLYRQELPAIVFENIAEIKNSCRIAVDILTDLLAYEKLESGLLVLEKSLVNALSFTEDILRPFRLAADSAGLNLRLTVDDATRTVLESMSLEVDASKMSQVLRNVMSNAIKFSHVGGDIVVNLRVTDAHSDRRSLPLLGDLRRNAVAHGYDFSELLYRIEVIDHGYGISPENLKKLFHEVIQFEASAQQGGGGSGLGLWISKKIIDLHHGKIEVQSEGLGHGCTFSVEIPLIDSIAQPLNPLERLNASAAQSNAEVSHSVCALPFETIPSVFPVLTANNSGDSHRSLAADHTVIPPLSVTSATNEMAFKYDLLVVDDSGPTRKMTCQMLKFDGHNCIPADDGLNAIKTYKECLVNGLIFDAILMDNLMPNMNGPEACKAIRDLGYIGVILGVTGNALPVDIEEYEACGANKVLIKPVSAALVYSSIEECKRTRRAWT